MTNDDCEYEHSWYRAKLNNAAFTPNTNSKLKQNGSATTAYNISERTRLEITLHKVVSDKSSTKQRSWTNMKLWYNMPSPLLP